MLNTAWNEISDTMRDSIGSIQIKISDSIKTGFFIKISDTIKYFLEIKLFSDSIKDCFGVKFLILLSTAWIEEIPDSIRDSLD